MKFAIMDPRKSPESGSSLKRGGWLKPLSMDLVVGRRISGKNDMAMLMVGGSRVKRKRWKFGLEHAGRSGVEGRLSYFERVAVESKMMFSEYICLVQGGERRVAEMVLRRGRNRLIFCEVCVAGGCFSVR